ncbi:hypothetical protein ABPG72_000254 [Tetrahymena utriculariae]
MSDSQLYKFIQTIDIYGNNYYQFTDRQDNTYKVYSETIPDELKFLGSPIKNKTFINRLKIIAANNIQQLLEMKEYNLNHDCCSVRRDEFWLKYPLVPKSCIQFNTLELYKNHVSMVERISSMAKQDFKSDKQCCLKMYSQNSQYKEITVECISQNLLEVIQKIKVAKTNEFVRNFTYLLEEMYKKILKKIDLLVNKFQIFQTDISFQNIILTTEGKWEFLSYATAIEINSRKKTPYYPAKKAFIFEKYQDGGNYTQPQFFDSSIKSLVLVMIQAILIVYGDLKEPLKQVKNEDIFKYFAEIRYKQYVQVDLINLINMILSRDLQKSDYNISLFKIDKQQVLQTFQLLDNYIKEYKQFYKFFTESRKTDIKFAEPSSDAKSDDQLLMCIQLRQLDAKTQSAIMNKFILNVTNHNDNISKINQALHNLGVEAAIKRLNQNLDPAKFLENFIKRIKVNNLPQKKDCYSMLPEISTSKTQAKQTNKKEKDMSTTIDIQDRDYFIACAILKHNKHILNASLKVSGDNIKKEDDNIFKNILIAFTQNRIIQQFACIFEDVQFNQEQFQQLSNALVNNQCCQIYELYFDKTNLQSNQITELKEALNNRQLTQSFFVSYKQSNFKKETNNQFNIIIQDKSNENFVDDPMQKQIDFVTIEIPDPYLQSQTNQKDPKIDSEQQIDKFDVSVTQETSSAISAQNQPQINQNLNNNLNGNDTIHKNKNKYQTTQNRNGGSNNQQQNQTSKNIKLEVPSQNDDNKTSENIKKDISNNRLDNTSDSNLDSKGNNNIQATPQEENNQLSQSQILQSQDQINIDSEEQITPKGMRTASSSTNSQATINEGIDKQEKNQIICCSKSDEDLINFQEEQNPQFKTSQNYAQTSQNQASQPYDPSIQSQNDQSFNKSEKGENIQEDYKYNQIDFQDQKRGEAEQLTQINELSSSQSYKSFENEQMESDSNHESSDNNKKLDEEKQESSNQEKINPSEGQQNLKQDQKPENINNDSQSFQNDQKQEEFQYIRNLDNEHLNVVDKDSLNNSYIQFQIYDNIETISEQPNQSLINPDIKKCNKEDIQNIKENISVTQETQQTQAHNVLIDNYVKEFGQQDQKKTENQTSQEEKMNNSNLMSNNDIQENQIKINKQDAEQEKKQINEILIEKITGGLLSKNINQDSINIICQESSNVELNPQNISVIQVDHLNKDFLKNDPQSIKGEIIVTKDSVSIPQSIQLSKINQQQGSNNNIQQDIQKKDISVTQETMQTQAQKVVIENYGKEIRQQDFQNAQDQASKVEKINECQENQIKQVDQLLNKQDVQQEKELINQIIIEKSPGGLFSNNINSDSINQNITYEESSSVGLNPQNIVIQSDDLKKDFQKNDPQSIKDDLIVTKDSVSIPQSIQLSKINQQQGSNNSIQQDIQKKDISVTQENQQTQAQKVLISNYINEIGQQEQKSSENQTSKEEKIFNSKLISNNESQENQIKQNKQDVQQEKSQINEIIIEKSTGGLFSNNINYDSTKQNILFEESSSVGLNPQNISVIQSDDLKKDFQKNDPQSIKDDLIVTKDSVSISQSIQLSKINQQQDSNNSIQQDIQKKDISVTQENQQTQAQKVLISNYINEIGQQEQKSSENQTSKEEKIFNSKLISNNESQENQIKQNKQDVQQEKSQINEIIIEKSTGGLFSNNINYDSTKQNILLEESSSVRFNPQNIPVVESDDLKKYFLKNDPQSIKGDLDVTTDSVSMSQSIQLSKINQQQDSNNKNQQDIQKKDIQKSKIQIIKEEVSVTNEIESPRQSTIFNQISNQSFTQSENISLKHQIEEIEVSQQQLQYSQNREKSQYNSEQIQSKENTSQFNTLGNFQKQNIQDNLLDNQSQTNQDNQRQTKQDSENSQALKQQHDGQQIQSNSTQVNKQLYLTQNENHSLLDNQFQQLSQQQQQSLQSSEQNQNDYQSEKTDQKLIDQNEEQDAGVYTNRELNFQSANGFNFEDSILQQQNHQSKTQDEQYFEKEDYNEDDENSFQSD